MYELYKESVKYKDTYKAQVCSEMEKHSQTKHKLFVATNRVASLMGWTYEKAHDHIQSEAARRPTKESWAKQPRKED